MSYGFTKLFSSILDSTIWRENSDTCKVWVTLLAMADADGYVTAAVPGLADRARLPLEVCEECLAILMAPDPYSRTPENDGRRLERSPEGWLITNYRKYRETFTADQRRQYMADYMRKKRAADKLKTDVNDGESLPKLTDANVSTEVSMLVQAEAEAEAINLVPAAPSPALEGGGFTLTPANPESRFQDFVAAIDTYWKSRNPDIPFSSRWDDSAGKNLKTLLANMPNLTVTEFTGWLRNRYQSAVNHAERPRRWIAALPDYADGPLDRFGRPTKQRSSAPPAPPADPNAHAFKSTTVPLSTLRDQIRLGLSPEKKDVA